MPEEEFHWVFLGLGGNIGDRKENLLKTLRMLDNKPGISVEEVSSVYESEPWGVTDQAPFLNMVALVSTALEPRRLLTSCMEVETEMGRVRGEKWGPRLMDIDILLFDDVTMREEDLSIPHPHMLEREFVMAPLLELRPGIVIPGKAGVRPCYPPGGEGKVTKAFRLDEEEWHGNG
ncbi:MAG: 2-amino-4-hydroxy-6-hydroxymethyldihydropteridine diphosphokinase [Actinobacteria bacterium RBG_19FT_COMBO_54_7]|uniref:2-amino-4-hydroxy-6-hydroxymethyldihydropteridine diphosphokinase n=1 Tax=Candidatus Solincola sediminis TaxID=1797199 RepID=A0A1F2WQC3_9ACTN|nr:MAG: 2-amino-4-hydroxy-6-hydroxymethyldihydropteridine diphosphokinase [Candidatus Solincola sediminis]OFW61485.1 MAG: 2-amino-4-hydroxy-6-hydroxymethyldihydropteridine diphosphokinase [Candidatus Solincola sediminis]OFW65458.1 MAG: 2-amino-4-hydroxy-6-hydroxymethyldihydropteridine diphosphokinase [Actinobacteria bacterium RBG_19FT_COMBO_54_7]